MCKKISVDIKARLYLHVKLSGDWEGQLADSGKQEALDSA